MQPLNTRHIQEENPEKKKSKSQKDLKSARNIYIYFLSKIGKKYVYEN